MQRQHLLSKTGFATGILSAALISTSALGAGFEKNVFWSGKWVGVGGAAVSAVQGAESLFFNPAGLASGRQGFEVSGNFSPTWGEFKGPINNANTQLSTGYNFVPPFGALVSYGITPQWGVGVGAFVAAGTKADYSSVGGWPSTGVTGFPAGITAPIQSDIYVVDYSIGTGYELIPGLRVGAAWRISQVKAGVKTAFTTGTLLTTRLNFASIDDITATRYNGFRVGAQYTAPDKKWGAGVNYRSNIDFTGHGNLTNTDYALNVAGGASTTTTVNGVAVATALPTQIEVGGNYAVTDTVRMFLDYVWTNYSHDQAISITGGSLPNGATVPDVQQGWRNQSNVRVAAECTAIQDWAFRAGYVWTSQVTPETLARATFDAPGHGNTVTVGAGHSFMNNNLSVDGALERSWVNGSTTAAQQQYWGDYFTADWALHLGATFRL